MKTSAFATMVAMGVLATVIWSQAFASESKLPPVREGMSFSPQAELRAQAKAQAPAVASTKATSTKPVVSRPAPVYENAGSLAPEDSNLYSVYGQ